MTTTARTQSPLDEWLRRSSFGCVKGEGGLYWLCNTQGKRVTDRHPRRDDALLEKAPREHRNHDEARKTRGLVLRGGHKRGLHCWRCGGLLGLGEHGVHRGVCPQRA